MDKSSELGADLFGGFGPSKWFAVLVPRGDAFAGVGFEGLNVSVVHTRSVRS
jgi:hypothetical protein